MTSGGGRQPAATQDNYAIAVLDANFVWTRDLFIPLAKRMPVYFMRPVAFRNARAMQWPLASLYRMRTEGNLSEKRWALPPGWFSQGAPLSFRYLARELNAWKRQVFPRRLVVVTTYPQYASIARRVAPALSVYYWTDEFRVYWASRREQVVRQEQEAVANLGLTVCVSESKARLLREEVPAAAGKVTAMTIGYHTPLLRPGPSGQPSAAPDDIAKLPRPIIGHWGQVSRNLDLQMLHEAAITLPQASFVMVGSIQDNFEGEERVWYERVRGLPNVHFVGARPYPRIVEYVPSFDICMVLYRTDTEFTKVLNPSKVREYLGAGRLTVSTPIEDVAQGYDGLVHIGRTPKEFAAALARLVQEGDDGRARERWEWARAHTWEKAAEHFWQIVSQRLPAATGAAADR